MNNDVRHRLGYPLSRAELKAMVRREQWSRIGVLYGFTPRYTAYRGARHFDWLSCSPEFMAAFFPKPKIDPAQAQASIKSLTSPPNCPRCAMPLTGGGCSKCGWYMRARPPRRPPGDSPRAQRHRLVLHARQAGRCYYCGVPKPISDFSVDHVTPRSRGGSNATANKVGACKRCNHAKGNMTLAEFVATGYLCDTRRTALGWDGRDTVKYQTARDDHARRESVK